MTPKQKAIRYANDLFYSKYQDLVPYISNHDINEANKAVSEFGVWKRRIETDEEKNWERNDNDKYLHNI